MGSRSFQIWRDGDDDPLFIPDPVDKRPIRAYRVDGVDVTKAEYEAAHAEWHDQP